MGKSDSSPRKFFKQHILIEVLSEDESLDWGTLDDIEIAMTDGDCSGKVTEISCEEVDGPTMAKLLMAQESSPSFFSLTEDGEELCKEED